MSHQICSLVKAVPLPCAGLLGGLAHFTLDGLDYARLCQQVKVAGPQERFKALFAELHRKSLACDSDGRHAGMCVPVNPHAKSSSAPGYSLGTHGAKRNEAMDYS